MQTGVGKKILEARKALKLSQGALARATGASRPTISNWENSRFLPELASINKLSAALGKPASYFLADNAAVAQVSEQAATYGVSGNTVRLPLLSHPPEEVSNLRDEHIEGYIELPRFMGKGARYILQAPDKSGDYYLIRPETQFIAGKTLLLVSKNKYKVHIAVEKPPPGSRVAGQVVKVIKDML
jgi:transcriptional regulator with XRE-family HTH domain